MTLICFELLMGFVSAVIAGFVYANGLLIYGAIATFVAIQFAWMGWEDYQKRKSSKGRIAA
jgi:hypothetical protein